MLDSLWIDIQTKTFARFVNKHVKKFGIHIKNLETDLSDGIALIKLVETLSNKSVGRYHPKPRLVSHRLENVTSALNLINSEGIKLVNIDSGHIVGKNLKLILGLIWALILHYSISLEYFPSDKKVKKSPKEQLLTWVAEQAQVPISNFTTHWNDGKAVGSLVDSFKPGLCPNWRYWDKADKLKNTTEAMQTAEKWLSVPMLITPEEITNPHVDEKSVITYVAQFSQAHLKEGAPLKRPEPPFEAHLSHPGFDLTGYSGQVYEVIVEVTKPIEHRTIEMCVETEFGMEIPVNIRRDSEFSYHCSFVPTTAGRYVSSIKYDCRSISPNPFLFNVENRLDIDAIRVSGQAIKTGYAGVSNYFRIYRLGHHSSDNSSHSSADQFESIPTDDDFNPLVYMSYGDGTKNIPVSVKRVASSVFQCKYKPCHVGDHHLEILFDGVPHPESPFAVKVERAPNPNDITLTGEGLRKARQVVGHDNHIYLDSSMPLTHSPTFIILDSDAQRRKYKLDKIDDKHFKGIFAPRKAGPHQLNIRVNGVELLESPFIIDVLSSIDPVKHVNIWGKSIDQHSILGEKISFYVDIRKHTQMVDESCLQIQMTKQDGPGVPCRVEKTSENLFLCTCVSEESGDYEIEVKYLEESILSKIPVITVKEAFDHSLCSISYQGDAAPNTPFRFSIHSPSPRNPSLQVLITTPDGSKSETTLTSSGSSYDCQFMPQHSGRHSIDVLHCGQSISGAPFDVLVGGKHKFYLWGNIFDQVYANTPAFFVVGGRSPKEFEFEVKGPSQARISTAEHMDKFGCLNIIEVNLPGKYSLRIFSGDAEIPQSPVTIDVKPEPAPNMIKIIGLEGIDAVEPMECVKFMIEGAGTQNLKIGCYSKKGNDIPMNVRQTTSRVVQCDLVVKKRWSIIVVEHNNAPVMLSPYILKIPYVPSIPQVDVSFSRPPKVGQLIELEITYSFRSYLERFTDSSSESEDISFDFNACRYYVVSDQTQKVVEVTGDCSTPNSFRCFHTPSEFGPHSLIITYHDKNIHDYGFLVKRAYDITQCRTLGRGFAPKGVRVGDQVDFTVVIPSDDEALLSLHGEDPNGSHISFVRVPNAECGQFSYRYSPDSVGKHKINILFDGEQIPGCPFSVSVSPPSEHGKRILVPSGSRGFVGFPVSFILKGDDDISKIDFYLRGPAQSEIKIVDLDKGHKEVYFVPDARGEFIMRIFHDNEDLPGSPFHINVMENPGFTPDDVIITVSGPKKLYVWESFTFSAALRGSDVPLTIANFVDYELSEEMAGKSMHSPKSGHNLYLATYDGVAVHNHPIIKHGYGEPVLGRVVVKGDAMENGAAQNEETDLYVDCSQSGYVDFDFCLVDDIGKEVDFAEITDDLLTRVTFTPHRGGMYSAHVLYKQEHIPGSPFPFHVLPLLDTSSIVIEDKPFETFVGSFSRITVDHSWFKDFSIELLESVLQASDSSILPSRVFPSGDNQCDIVYTLKYEGDYSMHVSYSGCQVRNSPAMIIGKRGFDPSCVTVNGNGLQSALAGTSMSFTVDRCNAGPGELMCTITGPMEGIKANIHSYENGTDEVVYNAEIPGSYSYSIKMGGIDVHESPFDASVFTISPIETQNVHFCGEVVQIGLYVNKNCDVLFTPEVTNPCGHRVEIESVQRSSELVQLWFIPPVPGQYHVNANQHVHEQIIPLCILDVHDQASISLSPIEQPSASLTSQFTVDASQVPGHQLDVEITNDIPVTVEEASPGKYRVSFTPEEVGHYSLTVKYGRKSVFFEEMEAPATGDPSAVFPIGQLPKVVPYDTTTEMAFNTSQAGEGRLLCTSWDENGKKYRLETVEKDGITTAFFTPPNCGCYLLEFKFGGQLSHSLSVDVVREEYYRCLTSFLPVEFVIPVFGISGTIAVDAVLPSGENFQFDEVCAADDKLRLLYQPRQTGKHTISKICGLGDIPNLEFYVNEKDCPLYAYGQGLSVGVENETCTFFLDCSEGHAVELEINIIGPSKPDVSCHHVKENLSRIEYFPSKAGKYRINIMNNGNHIPGSPFNAIILESIVSLSSADFDVALSAPIDGLDALDSLESFMVNPSGARQDCLVREMSDSHIVVEFLPTECGCHLVHLYSEGIPLKDSPFPIDVGEKALACPPMVEVTPITAGKVGYINSFDVSTANAGFGLLSAYIRGPSQCKVQIKPKEDSKCAVMFQADEPGEYQVCLMFSNQIVPGCPFTVTIMDQEFCEASYLQSPQFFIGQTCDYSLKIPGCSLSELSASVVDQNGDSRPCQLSQVGPDSFSIGFTPMLHGEHQIFIYRNQTSLSGSPFLFFVGPANSKELKIRGSGLSRGQVNSPCSFNVYTHGLNDGNFSISICGPSKAVVNIDQQYNEDCFGVSYAVTVPGTYKIYIYHDNQPTPNSPYIVQIEGQFPPTLIQHCDRPMVKTPLNFTIENAIGDVSAYVIDPLNQTQDCSLSLCPDGFTPLPREVKLEFVPTMSGTHHLHVLVNDIPQITEEFYVELAKHITMEGPGLTSPQLDQENTFVVTTNDTLEGTLFAIVEGPSPILIEYDDTLDCGYKFGYVTDSPGDYIISVKFTQYDDLDSAMHISNSPQVVSIPGTNNSLGLSRHRSECVVPVSSTTPNLVNKGPMTGDVKIYGLSPRKPCGTEHTLTLCGEGDENLMVGMSCKNRKMFEMKVRHDGKDSYNVTYRVDEPGLYWLSIHWGGKPCSGSPFPIEFF